MFLLVLTTTGRIGFMKILKLMSKISNWTRFNIQNSLTLWKKGLCCI